MPSLFRLVQFLFWLLFAGCPTPDQVGPSLTQKIHNPAFQVHWGMRVPSHLAKALSI